MKGGKHKNTHKEKGKQLFLEQSKYLKHKSHQRYQVYLGEGGRPSASDHASINRIFTPAAFFPVSTVTDYL